MTSNRQPRQGRIKKSGSDWIWTSDQGRKCSTNSV